MLYSKSLGLWLGDTEKKKKKEYLWKCTLFYHIAKFLILVTQGAAWQGLEKQLVTIHVG